MKRDALLVANIYTINDVRTVRSYKIRHKCCNVYVQYYTQSLLYVVSVTYFICWAITGTYLYYNTDCISIYIIIVSLVAPLCLEP